MTMGVKPFPDKLSMGEQSFGSVFFSAVVR